MAGYSWFTRDSYCRCKEAKTTGKQVSLGTLNCLQKPGIDGAWRECALQLASPLFHLLSDLFSFRSLLSHFSPTEGILAVTLIPSPATTLDAIKLGRRSMFSSAFDLPGSLPVPRRNARILLSRNAFDIRILVAFHSVFRSKFILQFEVFKVLHASKHACTGWKI